MTNLINDVSIIDIYDPKLKGLSSVEMNHMVDVINVNRQLMRLKMKRESMNRSIAANRAWVKRKMKTSVVTPMPGNEWLDAHEHSQHFHKIKDLLN